MTPEHTSVLQPAPSLIHQSLPNRVTLNTKASSITKRQVYSQAVVPSKSGIGLRGAPIDELLLSIGKYSKRYFQGYRDSLSVILLETLALRGFVDELQDPTAGYALCLPRRDEVFVPVTRYRLNSIGHTQWCRLIDDLVSVGLLDKLGGGYKTREHFSGITSFYGPTPALSVWLDNALPRLQVESLQTECERLILKTTVAKRVKGKVVKRKLLVDYHDDELTNELRRQVAHVTAVCQAHRFEIWNPKAQAMERVPPLLFDYRRSFREDFHGGGRIFCLAQSWPKARRKTLTIDGKSTVELDYQSHQMRMLYHLHGMEAAHDCYQDPLLPRSLIKAATTRVMNCGSMRKALGTLQKLLEEGVFSLESCSNLPQNLTARTLLDSVFRLNPILEQTMGEKLWRELQYLESCVALSIMEELAAEGHACLGIHDSFIVSEDGQNLLQQLMIDKYRERLGFDPIVTKA